MSTPPAKIGIIGCGNISDVYLKNATGLLEDLEVVAVADLVAARAEAKAEAFAVPRALAPDALIADAEVEIVVNLTVPAAHAPVAEAALLAGKHVHNEKPLAIRLQEAKALLEEAEARRLRLGSAPDTFLGGGHQTARALLDEGAVGRPVAATAFMMGGGPERWHPDPAFFYQPGGGPMFDMGPYYLTALVHLLGPVRRVAGMTTKGRPERVVGSGAKKGERIPVQVPTHIVGALEFAAGAIGTLITSFDVPGGAAVPRIEIYGTEGTLAVPDPNGFGGMVRLRMAGEKNWTEVPVERPYTENSRGLGVADMARAIRTGRPNRASGALAYHVLEVMHAIHEAATERRHVDLESTCDRPAPLPANLAPGTVDD